MQRLVRDLNGQTEVDWAAAAARHGYADQPHLADEFRDLVGVTPASYLRSRVDGPNHLRFPVQGALVLYRFHLHISFCLVLIFLFGD